MVARERGEDTSTEPESSGEEEEEDGEVTPPPQSPSCETLPSFGDIISRQAGITVGVHQPKQTQTGTEPSVGLPQQLCLTLVSPNSRGDKCYAYVDGTDSPTQDFTSPVELLGHCGFHSRDSRVVLIVS
jgi:hypothetical protein